MFCHKCGTQLADGAVFCHKCGTQMLSEKDVLMSSKESVINNTAIQQSAEREINRLADNQTHNSREATPLKRKSRKLPVFIGVIALALIIGIIFLVIGRKNDNNGYDESPDFVEEIKKNDSTLYEEVRLTKTFTNQKRGISFQYPAEWSILDSSGEYCIVEMVDSRNTASHIATYSVNIIFDQDPYGVYTQDKASVQENVNEYGEFLGLEDRILGGVPAKVLKYQKEGLRSDDIVTIFWYKAGEEVYQVTCSCTASTIETYEPIFEAIMNSYTVNTAALEQLQEDIFGFETDYREEYIYKIRELSAKDESIQFALIDLIDNGVPELVAEHSGYDVSVFTCVDEGIVTLMDQWPYGAMGNMGYEYLPGQNIIRNYNMESAGAIVYESYMKVDNSYEIVNIYSDDISIRYVKDTNADGIVDGEDEYSDDPIYYYGETEISKEEYISYQIVGEYEQIGGSMSADAMIDILSGDDEATEMWLEDFGATIEDYYRLSGLYSDGTGEGDISLSIYTSQEEGETAIGTAALYTDDEEIYLGEICLLEEGVYKIEMETGDEIILKESEGEDVIVLQLYGNGEYLGDCWMIEHYEP